MAILFHESAIVLIPFVVIAKYMSVKKKNITMCFTGEIIILLFGVQIMNGIVKLFPSYVHYLYQDTKYQTGLSIKFVLLYGCISIAGLIYIYIYHTKAVKRALIKQECGDKINIERYNIIMILFYNLSVVLLGLSSKFFLLDRFFDYFFFAFIIVVPNVIANTIKRGSQINVLKLLTYIVLIIGGMNRIINNLAGVYPYIVFWK